MLDTRTTNAASVCECKVHKQTPSLLPPLHRLFFTTLASFQDAVDPVVADVIYIIRRRCTLKVGKINFSRQIVNSGVFSRRLVLPDDFSRFSVSIPTDYATFPSNFPDFQFLSPVFRLPTFSVHHLSPCSIRSPLFTTPRPIISPQTHNHPLNQIYNYAECEQGK